MSASSIHYGATQASHEGLLGLRHVVVAGRRVDEVVVDLSMAFHVRNHIGIQADHWNRRMTFAEARAC